LIEEVTPAKMNFTVKNTKYPADIAAAIGKPTSATNLKKSIFLY
jgi:propanediol dehydratase small subunit